MRAVPRAQRRGSAHVQVGAVVEAQRGEEIERTVERCLRNLRTRVARLEQGEHDAGAEEARGRIDVLAARIVGEEDVRPTAAGVLAGEHELDQLIARARSSLTSPSFASRQRATSHSAKVLRQIAYVPTKPSPRATAPLRSASRVRASVRSTARRAFGSFANGTKLAAQIADTPVVYRSELKPKASIGTVQVPSSCCDARRNCTALATASSAFDGASGALVGRRCGRRELGRRPREELLAVHEGRFADQVRRAFQAHGESACSFTRRRQLADSCSIPSRSTSIAPSQNKASHARSSVESLATSRTASALPRFAEAHEHHGFVGVELVRERRIVEGARSADLVERASAIAPNPEQHAAQAMLERRLRFLQQPFGALELAAVHCSFCRAQRVRRVQRSRDLRLRAVQHLARDLEQHRRIGHARLAQHSSLGRREQKSLPQACSLMPNDFASRNGASVSGSIFSGTKRASTNARKSGSKNGPVCATRAMSSAAPFSYTPRTSLCSSAARVAASFHVSHQLTACQQRAARACNCTVASSSAGTTGSCSSNVPTIVSSTRADFVVAFLPTALQHVGEVVVGHVVALDDDRRSARVHVSAHPRRLVPCDCREAALDASRLATFEQLHRLLTHRRAPSSGFAVST
jgi:citrate lyase gamma subunit